MATATTTVQAQPGLDAREWDEGAYRQGILPERDLSCRTLFRAIFYDHRDEPDPHVLLAAASSDGSLASFSLSSCIASSALLIASCIARCFAAHLYCSELLSFGAGNGNLCAGPYGLCSAWLRHHRRWRTATAPYLLRACGVY